MTRKEKIKLTQNPNTSAKILKKLFKDWHECVRNAVLENPNCPEIIKLLYK